MFDKKKKIILIPGDGIGIEVIAAVEKVLSAFKMYLDTELVGGGYGYFLKNGSSLPEDIGDKLFAASGVIFGATGTPFSPPLAYKSPILELRKFVGGNANLRYCYNPFRLIDVTIVRECLEGPYSAKEYRKDDEAIAINSVSVSATKAVARRAWEEAVNRRGEVTIVHKANVLRITDGLFRNVAIETIESLGDVKWKEEFVDAAAYHLILSPAKYDVMLMNSSNGDILSDVGAAVCGSIGFVPSLIEGANLVLAEPIHGSAPDIAGKNIADPIGAILSTVKVLQSAGLKDCGDILEDATISHWRAYPNRDLNTVQVAMDIFNRCVNY